MEQDEQKLYKDMLVSIVMAGLIASGKVDDAVTVAKMAKIYIEEMEKQLENPKH